MSIAFSQIASRVRSVNAPDPAPIHWPSALIGLVLAVFVVVGVSWAAAPTRIDRPSPIPVPAVAEISAVATVVPTPIPAPPLVTPEPAAVVERLRVAFTNGAGVNLREDAGQRAQRLKSMPEGAMLEVIGADQTVDGLLWRNVKDAAGTSGWVAAKFVAPVQP
jgi:hypothetical protein